MEHHIITVTPARAKEYLTKNHSNRPLRPTLVNTYAADMIRGFWVENTGESLKFDKAGNLKDGQHRCHAIIKTNMSFRMSVVTGISDKAMDVIDTGSKRTAADALALHDVKNHTVVAAIIKSALSNVIGESSVKYQITNKVILDKYNDDPIKWDNISTKSLAWYRVFRALTTTMYGYTFFRILSDSKNTDKAIPFFNGLASGKDCPNIILDLRTKLINNSLSKHMKLTETAKIDLVRGYWNAYVKNRKQRDEKLEGWL